MDGRGEGPSRGGGGEHLRGGAAQWLRPRANHGVRHQVTAAVAGKAPSFMPIQICAESSRGIAGESEPVSSTQTKPLEIAAPATKLSGVIEIEMGGARIQIELGAKVATL